MKYKDFPEANLVMQHGGNDNTVGLKVEKCAGDPKIYKPGTEFFASRFELDDDEKKALRGHLEQALQQYYYKIANPEAKFEGLKPLAPAWIRNQDLEKDADGKFIIDPGALDTIMNALPPVWVISMHGWAPKIISIFGPGDLGYTHVAVSHSPKEN